MIRMAILVLPLALSGCILDVVDAGWTLATGQHMDAHWYDPPGETVDAGRGSTLAEADKPARPALGCAEIGCR